MPHQQVVDMLLLHSTANIQPALSHPRTTTRMIHFTSSAIETKAI